MKTNLVNARMSFGRIPGWLAQLVLPVALGACVIPSADGPPSWYPNAPQSASFYTTTGYGTGALMKRDNVHQAVAQAVGRLSGAVRGVEIHAIKEQIESNGNVRTGSDISITVNGKNLRFSIVEVKEGKSETGRPAAWAMVKAPLAK